MDIETMLTIRGALIALIMVTTAEWRRGTKGQGCSNTVALSGSNNIYGGSSLNT
jgi:hypothetical protein